MLNQIEAILKEKIFLTKEMLLLKFKMKNPIFLDFKAGQYLILKINDIQRLYSIFSSEFEKQEFKLLIKLVDGGIASDFFVKLKINSLVKFLGPAGLFRLRETNKPKIFLATYSGLAPLWSMISTFCQTNSNSNQKIYLFWGLRKKEEISLEDEFFKLQKIYPNFEFLYCLSQENNVEQLPSDLKKTIFLGRTTNALINKIKNFNNENYEYYICGSRDVVQSIYDFLLNSGINKKSIFFEKY